MNKNKKFLEEDMEKEYDFTNARKNPYAEKLKKQQVTMNLDQKVIEFFKTESLTLGIPYQTLINLYLKDCVENKRRLKFKWD